MSDAISNQNQISLNDLQKLIQTLNNPEIQELLDLNTGDYHAFIRNLYRNIYKSIRELESNANLYYLSNENQLTGHICSNLKMVGYNAIFDKNENGHCDITIEKGSFKWLAEAKVYTGTAKLWGGFQQLTNRYSVCTNHSCHGAELIYQTNNSSGLQGTKIIHKWKDKIKHENSKIKINDFLDEDERFKLGFDSTYEHTKSGLNYTVKHLVILLQHNPQD